MRAESTAASTAGDSISLTGLRVFAHHGVYDFERETGQEFVIDVTVWLDLAAPAASDDVAGTIHYGELALEVTDAVRRDPVDLIETVAERVASVVLAHESADAVRVTVHKPDAPIDVPFDDVAVSILRRRGGVT
jgi:dihydroneopterin aldolase